MRILILTRSFDQRMGGMENHTRLLVEHFMDLGWGVNIATPDIPAEGPVFLLPDANYIRLGKAPNNLIKYSPSFWLKIRKLLIDEGDNFDAIINVGMAIGGAYFIPQTTKNKIITIAHGTYFMERRTLIENIKLGNVSLKTLLGIPYTYLFNIVQCFVNKRSSNIVCVSKGVFDSLVNEAKTSRGKLLLVNNFVDIKKFRKLPKIPHDNFNLLFLARLHREKGLIFLIDTMAKMRDDHPGEFSKINCIVAGEGPDESMAKLRVVDEELLNSISFKGYVNREAIPALMAESDCFTYPTLRQEGAPLSILEAMASGLPVIATDIDGPNEMVVNGKSGLLFPVGDVNLFQASIIKLIDNKNMAKRIGREAIKRVENKFNAEVQLAIIDKLLYKTAGVKGRINYSRSRK